MDEKTTTTETLKVALKGYATGIALLMRHTDVDHVTLFVIRDADERSSSISFVGWRGEEKAIDHFDILED